MSKPKTPPLVPKSFASTAESAATTSSEQSQHNSGVTIAANKTSLKTKGTIGIIGLDLRKVVDINKKIVKLANAMGLTNDQQIPDIIAVALPIGDQYSYLKSAANICYDYGCDSLVVLDALQTSEADISHNFSEKIKIFTDFSESAKEPSVAELEALLTALAKEALEHALNLQKTDTTTTKKARRPNLVYDEVSSEKEVAQNLKKDLDERMSRINQRMIDGGYPILAAHKGDYTHILGGAGPRASVAQMEQLVNLGVPCIHSSVSCAPGKHKFETTGAQSYIDHYHNDLRFFSLLGSSTRINGKKFGNTGSAGAIVIPCNTAHNSIDKFCPEKKLRNKIVDIREILITLKSTNGDLILLGTDRTIGVDSNGHGGIYKKGGIYKEFCNKPDLDHLNFITPEPQDQKIIMAAIFDVKAGKMNDARDKILSIVEKLRDGKNTTVILGCTELPIPFKIQELSSLRLTDPVAHLAKNAKQFIFGQKLAKERLKDEIHGKNSSSDSSGEELFTSGISPQISQTQRASQTPRLSPINHSNTTAPTTSNSSSPSALPKKSKASRLAKNLENQNSTTV